MESGVLLIDGQNIASSKVDAIIRRCKLHTRLSHIKVYIRSGDEYLPDAQWLADNAVSIEGVICKPRKNSVDIRIAVDAIHYALYHEGLKKFFIATNDSDFTHVASRLLSYDKEVYVITTNRDIPTGYSKAVVHTPIVDEEQIVGSTIVEHSADQGVSSVIERKIVLKEIISGLLEISPFSLQAGIVYGEIRHRTGKPWKSKSSKQTAGEFFGDLLEDALFVESNKVKNDGFLMKTSFNSEIFNHFRSTLIEEHCCSLPIIGCSHTIVSGEVARIIEYTSNIDSFWYKDIIENLLPVSELYQRAFRELFMCLISGDLIDPVDDDDWSKPFDEMINCELKMRAGFDTEHPIKYFYRGVLFEIREYPFPDGLPQQLELLLGLPKQGRQTITKDVVEWLAKKRED